MFLHLEAVSVKSWDRSAHLLIEHIRRILLLQRFPLLINLNAGFVACALLQFLLNPFFVLDEVILLVNFYVLVGILVVGQDPADFICFMTSHV